jgi:hypothetical protein
MPVLTRRRTDDPRRESWSVYYDDIGIGTIGKRSGVRLHMSINGAWSRKCEPSTVASPSRRPGKLRALVRE